MKIRTTLLGLIAAGLVQAAAAGDEPRPTPPSAPWRGVHIMAPGHEGVALLSRAIREGLAPLGVNVLVLEIDHGYRFASHPDLGSRDGLTRDDARALAALCKAHGIRLIPQFNCLGHQSWKRDKLPLLAKHPEFNETPDISKVKNLYCLSWCPLHPGVNPIVFALIDELIEAFGADAFHVGMDEVFLIASDQCPRCKGKDPAELFARAVNDLHEHIVGQKKLTMLMWADRFLDGKATGYGKWEASENGTFPAIDRVPKDIIMCDWHYELRKSYPSVHLFQEKGFRVWPSTWKNQAAAVAFRDDAQRGASERMLGHLCTTWEGSDVVCRALLGERAGTRGNVQAIVDAMKACLTAKPAPEKGKPATAPAISGRPG